MNLHERSEIEGLIERTKSLVISAIDSEGMPILKAVTLLGHDSLERLYFCTSPSSEFFKWYVDHPLTSAYLFDDDPHTPYPSMDEKYYSLSLRGKMETVTDIEMKTRFLSEYLSAFYPDGVQDKNYHLVCFSVQSGRYYRGVTEAFLTLDFTLPLQ